MCLAIKINPIDGIILISKVIEKRDLTCGEPMHLADRDPTASYSYCAFVFFKRLMKYVVVQLFV